jgi:hypothetical protein
MLTMEVVDAISLHEGHVLAKQIDDPAIRPPVDPAIYPTQPVIERLHAHVLTI